ncbi:hypothetical protein OG21DRAFT_840293 [Imleria badia]|nr:hypothetical protein OG21DRAFT_840293 [Imleria badia]
MSISVPRHGLRDFLCLALPCLYPLCSVPLSLCPLCPCVPTPLTLVVAQAPFLSSPHPLHIYMLPHMQCLSLTIDPIDIARLVVVHVVCR